MTKQDLRIIFLGTPDFATASLRALVEGGYNVVAVVTMPDKPAGRGHQLQFSDVKKYALSVGLPVLQPEKLKDDTFIEQLRAYQADLQIVVAFRMLPEIVWSMPRLGTFNLHGSLLPQYRGAAPINWALINGDTTTGVTTFMLKHEIDTGNIIMQESTPIDENENVGSVYDRLMQIGQTLVTRTVDLIIESENTNTPLPTIPQTETTELRPAPKLFKDTCEIHFDQMTATQVKNFVRGLSPYPAAWANITIAGQTFENVKIHAVEVVEGTLKTSNKEIIIPCKEGLVRILELQAPGKKRMDAKAFLNGLH
jgi:methionyl-tRNA formyltransferase